MKIPKRFKLLGHTIEVVERTDLLHREDARGKASIRDCRIELQPQGVENPFPKSHVEQTFCHELAHCLFHFAGYSDDFNDELKVERISGLLHQALTTMEYED